MPIETGLLLKILGLTIGTVLALLRSWQRILALTPVAKLVALIRRRPIPPVRESSMNVAVTNLYHDTWDKEGKRFLLDELLGFSPVSGMDVDRFVSRGAKANEMIKRLVKESRADVLIHGEIVRLDGKSAFRLYWTTSGSEVLAKPAEKYVPDLSTMSLPPLFAADLHVVLGLVVGTRLIEATQFSLTRYSVAELARHLPQVRKLLEGPHPSWPSESLFAIYKIAAAAFRLYGEQHTDTELLVQSAEYFRQAISRAPAADQREVAKLHVDLGSVLCLLGERRGDIEFFNSGIAEFDAGLSLEPTPYQSRAAGLAMMGKAAALGNLAQHLKRPILYFQSIEVLGKLPSNPAVLRDFEIWIGANVNHANAKQGLADAFFSGVLVKEGVDGRAYAIQLQGEVVHIYRELLARLPPGERPREWSWAQRNLGNALKHLARLDGKQSHFEEAIKAYNAALTIQTKEDGPVDWAHALNGLAGAQFALGRLTDAIQSLRAAFAGLEHGKNHADRIMIGASLLKRLFDAVQRNAGEREAFAAEAQAVLEEVTAIARANNLLDLLKAHGIAPQFRQR